MTCCTCYSHHSSPLVLIFYPPLLFSSFSPPWLHKYLPFRRTGFQMAPCSRPPPSLNLISSSSPARPVSTSPSPTHRHSQSPFRYVKESQTMNEKTTLDRTPLSVISDEKRYFHDSPHAGSSRHYNPSSVPVTAPHYQGSPIPRQPSPFSRSPSPLLIPSQLYTRPRALRISNLLKPWIPLILYGMTSFGFLVAIAFWKNEVFQSELSTVALMTSLELTLWDNLGLDELSHWLRIDEQFGYAVLFALIFLTTFRKSSHTMATRLSGNIIVDMQLPFLCIP